MKVGDLVRLKNLAPDWGEIALITNINVTEYGLGQISLIASSMMSCAIPWIKRDKYIDGVINESR
jgi:hypothetical protein